MGYSLHATTIPVTLKQRLHPAHHKVDTRQRCSGPFTHNPVLPSAPGMLLARVDHAAFLA